MISLKSKLNSGVLTIFAGNPNCKGLKQLLDIALIKFVTPKDEGWAKKLKDIFKERISPLLFTENIPSTIAQSKLADIVNALSDEYQLLKIDSKNAEKVVADTGNEYFFENFRSLKDYTQRGVGYCIDYNGRVVSAATSMAQSNRNKNDRGLST